MYALRSPAARRRAVENLLSVVKVADLMGDEHSGLLRPDRGA
jgi:hypothetical protein